MTEKKERPKNFINRQVQSVEAHLGHYQRSMMEFLQK